MTTRGWLGARLGGAILGAAMLASFSLHSSPAAGRRSEAFALARSGHMQTTVAVAALGTAYLSGATSSTTPGPAVIDGGVGSSTSAPMRLNRALDPLWSGGALYPLRQAIQQLSIWLILPLILLSLGTAALKGAGSDVEFARVGKRLVVVVVLLWAYPVWDVVVFRGIAIPVSAALENATLRDNMAKKLGGRAQSGSSTGDLAQVTQKTLSCGAPGASGNPSSCPNVQGIAGNISTGFEAGNTAARDDNGQAGDSTGWLASTVTGWILTLFHLAVSVILWFIWLGVVIGRCLSLCFAPMAIVWGISEQGQSKATAWFRGHARICMAAPMFGFTALVTWVVFAAVFAPTASNTSTSAVLGSAVAGVALKAALFMVMFALLIKGKGMSDIIAGDVTKVVQDIGTGVRDKGLQAVATLGKGSFAAGAFMQHRGEASFKDRRDKIRTMLDSGDRRGAIKAMGGGIRDAGKGSLAAAKWMARNQVAANQLNNRGALSMKNLSSMTTGAYGSMKTQLMKDTKARPIGRKTAEGVAAAALAGASRAEEIEKLKGQGIKIDAHRRPGEVINIDITDLKAEAGKGFDRKTRAEIVKLSSLFYEAAKAHDSEFGAKIDPKTNGLVLDESTMAMLASEMDANPELKDLVNKVMARSWGPDMPKIAGVTGALPDISKGVAKSTILSEALAAAARRSDLYNKELQRRELISALAGVEPGSVEDMALRSMDPKLLPGYDAKAGGTVNKKETGEVLQGRAEANARQAWYRSSTPEQRAEAGLTITEDGEKGEMAARVDINLHHSGVGELKLDNLRKEGSFANLTPEFKQALTEVVGEQLAVFNKLSERHVAGGAYGFDGEGWKHDGVEKYNARSGSIFAELKSALEGKGYSEGQIYDLGADMVRGVWKDTSADLLARPERGASEADTDYARRVKVELNNRIFDGDAADVRSQIEAIISRPDEEEERSREAAKDTETL